MKTRIVNYKFNPGASFAGTVTFTSYSSITLDSILLITNVTSNIIIYNFADPAAGGTVSNNILTLDYNTSTMSSSDKLIIYYDDPVNITATDNTLQAINTLAQAQVDSVGLLKRIAEYTANLEVTDNQQRIKINVDTGSLGTTMIGWANTTASVIFPTPQLIYLRDAASNAVISLGGPTITYMYTIPDVWKFLDSSRLNFRECIRTNITFT